MSTNANEPINAILETDYRVYGLSKREYIAIKVFQSLTATWNSELSDKYRVKQWEEWIERYGQGVQIADALCMDAVEAADRLINALNKQEVQP